MNLFGFITRIRIYHDVRSPERQILLYTSYPDICLRTIKHAFLTQIRNILSHLLRSINVLINLITLDPLYFEIVKVIKQFVCVQ